MKKLFIHCKKLFAFTFEQPQMLAIKWKFKRLMSLTALAGLWQVAASAAALNNGWNGGSFKNGLVALLEGGGRLERTG